MYWLVIYNHVFLFSSVLMLITMPSMPPPSSTPWVGCYSLENLVFLLVCIRSSTPPPRYYYVATKFPYAFPHTPS